MPYVRFTFLIGITLAIVAGCGGGTAPQADAGQDFTVIVGTEPTFDGCASRGDIVNYQWTIVEAPDTMPGDAGKIIREVDPNCSFTLDANMGVDEVGQWVIELAVTDSEGQIDTDTVIVTVEQ
jgi:hypothetical protein